ncbi:MAG TPA: AbfB domain-containing protein, partial [Spirochaetota bacterium]|nr:AbfB domain-containing protein [Spirochaetota bacterium]
MKRTVLIILVFLTLSSCSFFKFSYDKTYSFRSYNFPEMYMRHSYYNAILTVLNTEIDVNDGSFKIVKGLSDPKGVSFESVNFSGYFL